MQTYTYIIMHRFGFRWFGNCFCFDSNGIHIYIYICMRKCIYIYMNL